MGIGRMAWRTAQAVVDIRRVRQGSDGKGAIPLTAPRTSINVSIHARRRVAFAAANLADVKKLKNAMGTTVNDVVLAICAGALRTYLLAGDELPDIPLVAVVPVSVTPEMAELKGSNKVSAMFVQLPCELDDPLERLRAVHEGTKGAKEEHKALGATTLQNWAEHATPNVFAAAARLYTRMKLADRHRPLANLVISNVPGPDVPALPGRQRDARHVPPRAGHGRHRAQHHHHELPGRPLLGAGLGRPSRPATLGHRGGDPRGALRAHGGSRAGARDLRRAPPSGARHAGPAPTGSARWSPPRAGSRDTAIA